ncbi:hypothetical protein [Aurantimonas sp. VKM B-3413]|uniref:hypothetical protein n=1 Tax=Aurantimonas sp. VKM B-3413 TaxID=2779401 RepID=UPI001E643225|nr:hypothetical protein [Aurantimonas sp. VKM B-3413]MCB8839756.1 hypothetical protein [Aurantimonas sp. VKM B-3413]
MQLRTLLVSAAMMSALPALAQTQTPPLAPADAGTRSEGAASVPAAPEASAAGTEAGAKSLEADLAAYFTRAAFDQGILRVTPDPEGYRITLSVDTDFSQLGEASSGHIRLGDYSLVVSRRDDGTWFVRGLGPIAASFDMKAADQSMTMTYQVDNMSYSGIFSPEVGSFLSAAGTFDRTTMTQTTPQSEVDAKLGPQSMELNAVPAAGGGIDFTYSQTGSKLSETINSATDPAHPDQRFPVDLKAESIILTGNGAGLKSKPILDLYAFILANASDEKIIAAQDELKTRLRGLLPLWDQIESAYAFNDVSISTQVGRMTADRAGFSFSGDGVETNGSYRYVYDFTGMTFASPAIPDWAGELLPNDFTLAIGADGVDLDTPARIAIDDFDIARDPPISDAAGERIAAIFKEKMPRFSIPPSRVKAKDYEVTLSGDLRFEFNKPVATLDIKASGVETVINRLQAAGQNDPRALQALAMLQLGKGFAKSLADGKSQWLIAVASDGSVTVNGATVKGPDAPATDRFPTDKGNGVPL